MFKKLRERLVEEVAQAPSRFQAQDASNLTDNSLSSLPQAGPEQFSIEDEEDGSSSHTNSPQKENMSGDAEMPSISLGAGTGGRRESQERQNSFSAESHSLFPSFQPAIMTPYIPQSDIESEKEDPNQAIRLDNFTKEQLYEAFLKVKGRLQRHRSRYSELVTAYKDLHNEKEKIMRTLTESQDKALRRIGELREQCQLEQNAKAHLEENLRLVIEEKEETIQVLNTKIRLLKESRSDSDESGQLLAEKNDPTPEEKKDNQHTSSPNLDIQTLQEKVKRQDILLAKCKDTILRNKDQYAQLAKERDALTQQCEEKTKELQDIQIKEAEVCACLREELQQAKEKLILLEKQQEEGALSMAETKRNMHQELELKEHQLAQTKDELGILRQENDLLRLQIQTQEEASQQIVNELKQRLESTERTMEEDRQNMMQELSRGKAAALSLMQEESEKRIASVEESWKLKLEEVSSELERIIKDKNESGLQENIDSLQRELLDHQDKHLQEKDALVHDHHKELDEVRLCYAEQLASMEQEKQRIESTLQDQLQGMAQDITDMQKRHDDNMQEHRRAETDVKVIQLQNEVDALRQKNQELSKTLNDVEKDRRSTEEMLLAAGIDGEDQLNVWLAKCQHLDDEKNQILAEKSEWVLNAKTYDDKISRLQANLDQLHTEQEKHMMELSVLQQRAVEAEQRCIQKEQEVKEMAAKILSEAKEFEAKALLKDDLLTQLRAELQESRTAQNESAQQVDSLQTQLMLSQQETAQVVASSEDKIRERECTLENLWTGVTQELKAKIEDLENELKKRDEQLDESLLVAEANQAAMLQELNLSRAELEELRLQLQNVCGEKEDLEGKVQALVGDKATMETTHTRQVEALREKCEQLRIQCLSEEHPVMGNASKTAKTNHVVTSKIKGEPDMSCEVPEVTNSLEHASSIHSEDRKLVAQLKHLYEQKLSEKDEDVRNKLKQLVHELSSQWELKEEEHEQSLSLAIDKEREQQEKIIYDHRQEMIALEREVAEKVAAIEEVHEHYQEQLQVKEQEIRHLKTKLKLMKPDDPEVIHQPDHGLPHSENSGWDEEWADVEDHDRSSNSLSPVNLKDDHQLQQHQECLTHKRQIDALQDVVARYQDEVSELQHMLHGNHTEGLSLDIDRVSKIVQLPEPMEYEYLRNILWEYMMGKEPMVLAKVIAAVMRFDHDQTQQILKREEARLSTRAGWLSTS